MPVQRLAEETEAAGAGISLLLMDGTGGRIGAGDNAFENGVSQERWGATVGFLIDDGITGPRFLAAQRDVGEMFSAPALKR